MSTSDARDPARPPSPAGPAWDGHVYAANNGHHRAFDDDFLAPLSVEPDFQVLDVGCGTGDFTSRLAGMVPVGRVLGIDQSASQVEVARLAQAGHANLSFLTWDARRIGELGGFFQVPPAGFDLVVSVATLHWIAAADHPVVLAGMRSVLRPGGTLRADFGGAGQIADTRRVLDEVSTELGGPTSPWNFPGPEEEAALLRAAGFDLDSGWVRLVSQRRSLPNEPAFIGWLTSQVLIAYEAHMTPELAERFRSAAIERCLSRCRRTDGSFDQEYVRLDLLATAA
jgi:trans-aconitate 2-methyltransferase